MPTAATIFAYCERGANPAFWAEPLNAATNLAFVLAGLAAMVQLSHRPAGEGTAYRLALAGLVTVIGVGSFLFHTLATPAAALADTLPIALFMLAYLFFAGWRFAGMPRWGAALLVAAFVGVGWAMTNLRCSGGEIGFSAALPAFRSSACFGAASGYLPALAAMAAMGGWLALRRHAAAPWLLIAASVFAVSLYLRTVDRAWCGSFTLLGYRAGTHFLWHMLNGVTLYLLLLAAIRHGGQSALMRTWRNR